MTTQSLFERDICLQFITPALKDAGWDEAMQIPEEVGFTKWRIIIRGTGVTQGKASCASAATEQARLLEALLQEALEPVA